MTADVKPDADAALPPRRVRIAVNGVLLPLALVATWYTGVRPLLGLVAARQWTQTECEILSSADESRTSRDSSGKQSTSHKLVIHYRYHHAGREHNVDDIDFYGGFAFRDSVRRDFLTRFPADSVVPCYFDPDDPGEAVLDRGFRSAYLLGLIPALLSLMFWSGLRHALWPPLEPTPAAPAPAPAPVPTTGALTLTPDFPPRRRLAVAAFTTGTFLAVTAPMFGPTSFPFVAAALGGLGWIGYQLLALANPVPRLIISRPTLAVGDSFELTWHIDGATDRLRNLRITLECSEWQRVQSGNKSQVHVTTLSTQPIHGDAVLASGTTTVTIAPNALATGANGRNIEWVLHVVGQIDRSPDLDEAFKITVLRAAPQS